MQEKLNDTEFLTFYTALRNNTDILKCFCEQICLRTLQLLTTILSSTVLHLSETIRKRT